jgi:hypothetical protein
MEQATRIHSVEPTVFLTKDKGRLRHLVRLTIESPAALPSARLKVIDGGRQMVTPLGMVSAGESRHECYLDEKPGQRQVELVLENDGIAVCRTAFTESPPRHWKVHVIQRSHHDPGYTDLPSRVFKLQARYLDRALDMAEGARSFPGEAQFRIVIESAWSLMSFLSGASAGRKERMIRLLRSGQFEVTALFGNMTTELCGHEEMIRCLYPSFRLAREHGFPVVSAEHNDIPGFSWGLSRVLADAGIRIFIPGIPDYYGWGQSDLPRHWDGEAVFGRKGPGAFLWESPAGKRVLFWCNDISCGGDARADMPGLEERLESLVADGYPWATYAHAVGGGARDNSPYIPGYTSAIRDWNSRWAFPRLVCSTNALFCSDFTGETGGQFPVRRGELPGQDYPLGSTSTAAPSGANRRTHSLLLSAEKLASLWEPPAPAGGYADPERLEYRTTLPARAYEEVLLHDEHTWGYHFPCGPAREASHAEKAVRAYTGHAFAHEILRKSMAVIADSIRLPDDGWYLVVFNTLSWQRTGRVIVPLREIDNCGNTMIAVPPEKDPKGSGYLRGAILVDRWPAHPPAGMVEGKFDLVDVESGTTIPFQIDEIRGTDPVADAPERSGIGSGGRRYGLFEDPRGLRRDLSFVARDVPSCGYRLFKLAPRQEAPQHISGLLAGESWIENEFFRVEIDPVAAVIDRIFDKTGSRELLDPACPFSLGEMIVREPGGKPDLLLTGRVFEGVSKGPISASLEITAHAHGHPMVREVITLFASARRIELAVRVLKDATPLLDASIAFPFAASRPRFRYEGTLCAVTPIDDFLPGAYMSTVATQNWLAMSDGTHSILWSAPDCGIVSLGDLWPSRVSPAHSCILEPSVFLPPQKQGDLARGWVFSRVFANNFGTNFSVSQSGEVLFRYIIQAHEGELTDPAASRLGWETVTPLEGIFTDSPSGSGGRMGRLPASAALVSVEGEDVVLLNAKLPEAGQGLVLRLWNLARAERTVRVRVPHVTVRSVVRQDIVERDTGGMLPCDPTGFSVSIGPGDIATVRLTLSPAR